MLVPASPSLRIERFALELLPEPRRVVGIGKSHRGGTNTTTNTHDSARFCSTSGRTDALLEMLDSSAEYPQDW
jgi:hypothetical protein